MSDFDMESFLADKSPSGEDGNAKSSGADFDMDAFLDEAEVSAPPPGIPVEERESFENLEPIGEETKKLAELAERGLVGKGKKYLGSQNGEDVFEYDAENAPAFVPQDDEGRAVYERVKSFNGVTLDHFDRPMRINRDEKGFVTGYSTTESTVVPELDGTFSVIPTMWRGEGGAIESAIDEEDAARHYRDTFKGKTGRKVGERFGNFATLEEAEAAAKDIHDLHQRAYQQKWNQWIHEHWDEMSDEIRNFPGMAEIHAAWEEAGRPGVRFGMKTDRDGEGDGAKEWPDGAKKKGEPLGALERLQMNLQQETGERYSKGSALGLTLAPFGTQAEAAHANQRTDARERLRSGDYANDEEARREAEIAGLEGVYEDIERATAGGGEEAEGRRRELLSMAAEAALLDEIEAKNEAAQTIEDRPQTTWGKAVTGLITTTGYGNSFIYGSMIMPAFPLSGRALAWANTSGAAARYGTGIIGTARTVANEGLREGMKAIGRSAVKSAVTSIPITAVGTAERATGFANKSYEIDEYDRVKAIDDNYGTLASLAKGGAGSLMENLVVEGLTDEAINLGVGVATSLLGLAKIPGADKSIVSALKGIGGKATRKLMQNKFGRALLLVGKGYNKFSQVTNFESMPSEQFEEIIQPIFDDVLGLDKRKGERTQTFGEYADKMFTWQNQADIALGLVGYMLVQAGGGYVVGRYSAQGRQQAKDAREARQQLIDASADPAKVRLLSDEDAMSLANFYVRLSGNPDLLTQTAERLGNGADLIVDEMMSRVGAKMGGELRDLGGTPREFTIPTRQGADGRPEVAFQKQLVKDGATGEMHLRNVVADEESGVYIIDNDAKGTDRAYTVRNDNTGESADFMSIASARRCATLLINEQMLMEKRDEAKMNFIENLRAEQYGNANVEQYRTLAEAVEAGLAHGVDVTKDKGFRPDRRGWNITDKDGNRFTILVRDNIKSPWEVERVMRHENVGHSATANGVEFMDEALRGRNPIRGTYEDYRRANEERGLGMDDGKILREAVANTLQMRSHNPTRGERLIHGVRDWLRRHHVNLGMSNADMEVEVAKIEAEMRGSSGTSQIGPTYKNRTEFTPYEGEAEEGVPDEAGNGADEAQPQPEQGEERGQEAPQPEAGAEPGAQAPDAGVVEPSNTVENLRDASDKASQALQDAESRLSKWLKDHPRQETEDGRVSYGNGGTVREFRELEAAVDAAREKSESAEAEYRKAKRAEDAERQKSEEQRKLDAKKRRDEERKKWRDENPVTAQLEDIEKNVLLPAENELEDLLDSDASTNEQKAEAYRKVREARKVVDDFKSQHKEELEQEAANRKAGENANGESVDQSKSDNGGQNPNTAERPVPADSIGGGAEAKKPKGKRGHNLKGFSYEDYGADPDGGGTGDQMGAALLRYAKENGGILAMPNKGDPDPLADWIDSFLDGNARKNRRGAFIALFGMSPRRGGNDTLTEGMPPELEAYLNRIIESRGIEAVPEMLLKAREDFAKWVGDKRRAQAEAKNAPQTADEGDVVSIAEIEARDAADAEYDNAYAEVERYEAGSPVIRNFSREQMRTLKRGDVLRFDHADASWDVVGYDAENDVVTVVPRGALDNPLMTDDEIAADMVQYRVSADGAQEIKPQKGTENGRKDERGAAEAVAGDAQGAPARTGGEAQGGGFRLESATAEQIAAEERRRREKAEIKKRQEAPLKGSGAVNVQPEMDLGQTGQQDLFSPIAEKPENASTSAPRAEGTTTPPKTENAPQGGESTAGGVESKDFAQALITGATNLNYYYEHNANKASVDYAKKQLSDAMAKASDHDLRIAVKVAETERGQQYHRTKKTYDGKPLVRSKYQAWEDIRKAAEAELAKRAAPAAKPTAARPVSPVSTGEKTKKPAFKRGDRVFIKDAKDGQRVTFLKANADGTADVQVRTPGANRYAPEKVETRTVPMGEISSTGMKDTLTDAEQKRLADGMKAEAALSIRMKDEAAEKLAQKQEDELAALFDTPELAVEDYTNAEAVSLNFDTPELAGVNVRTKAPPKKTGIGYKVFVRGKDGGLYPPMVANPNGAATPVGVWIDASEGIRAEQSKTGREKVKAGGKGTNGGSGSLAWRPGWHLGEIPYALQFNVGPKVPNPLGIKNAKGEVIKIGEFFPGNFVWAEVEYAADVDYQDEAMSYGRTPSGKFNHALAGLPRLPVDGSYKYRTNANPATDPWIITGSMKVNRVLTDDEVDAIVRRAGREPQKRESEAVQKFLVWAKKWKLDPSKQKVRDEWSSRNGVSFDTPEFDPDMFQKRVGAVAKLVKTYKDSGVADFKTLATRMAERFPDKFGAMKPYLRGVWNAVAEQMDLDEVSKPQAEAIYAAIEKPKAQTGEVSSPETAAPEAPKPPPANKLTATRISDAAEEIIKEINNLALQGKVLTRKRLTEIVENQLGGKVANGDIEAKQVTDILELAVNRHLKASWFAPKGNAEAAVLTIRNLRDYLKLIPTQTTRSVEQDKMQQFSTPPTEAFAAAWVANITDNDVMLEPSAGIGGIAVFGANAGAKVVLNELSPRRAEILEQLGIGKPFEHNAENLYAFLEPDIKAGRMKRPTVVVMNPPFSNSQRTDKKNTHIGADHVEQALKLLAPGGRLVAIVGNGMAHDRPAFKAWWDRIGREYTVRANVGVNGQEYAKYGTTFDNNIIVIDKVTPNGSITPIYGKIESLDELPALLEGVRNDRPTAKDDQRVQPAPREQGGSGGVAPNGRNAGTVATPRPSTGGNKNGGGRTGTSGRNGVRPVRPQGPDDAGVGAENNGAPDGRGDGRGLPDGDRRPDANGLDNQSNSAGGVQPALGSPTDEGLAVQSVEQTREVGDGTFSEYKPSKISIPGMKPHPTALVESSAMASVQPPNPTYSPKIPKKIIEDGVLSEAQIEQVIYAGQAHEQMLGNGERKGYFIGDGTGVGKGREISGVILDNFNNGRRKAVWISKTDGLASDAKRDLTPFGLGEEIFELVPKNLRKLGTRTHGVAFTTYTSLAREHERVDERGNPISKKQGEQSRMQALVNWLGRDFDGVIVFDESHSAANAVAVKGKRGYSKPSAQALAVIDLQRLLPKARILYVSATGATEVRNLAYATRLGLWGKGTAFKDRDAFITQVSNGGISVMEIVARDMKAMGVYMARTLSYEGIENERVTHELSPDQVKQYNLLAETWQMVMGEMENALISSNGIKNGDRVSKVKSAFWGAHQRFFNQTLTAMQMPTVLKKARELWEAGYSPVFQIVTTNEAAQNRSLEKARKEGDGEIDVENLDLSPREILIQLVERSFPTAQYVEQPIPGSDKTRWGQLTDANGNPVQDPAAVERKERLIGRLQRMKIGEAPLDMILNEFGHENVAEISGRSSRREMVRNSEGEMETRMVRRTKNSTKQEAEDFNDGKRTVLVFSGAGNTGFSFHADRNFKNQRRRVQFMIEAGYNAAAAIQGLGRTHRSNESSHPLYMLCSTNLPGHKRFMSTIARRLAQLGSLTAGDRSSSGSGVFSEADNLENQYAKNAVVDIFEEMFQSDPAKFNRICTEMGFMKARVNSKTGEREYVNTLINEEGEFDPKAELDIPHFLNRILAMKIDAQNELFDEFSARMADDIERAKETGTFDPGMEKLKGVTVEVKNRTNLWTDAQKIGSADIVEVGVTKRSRKTDYATAKERMRIAVAEGAVPRVYTHNGSGDVLMMVETKQTKTMKDGSIVTMFRRLKPNGEVDYTTETAVEKNYTQVLRDEEGVWTRAYEATPDLIEQSRFFANGTLLPIWDRLNAQNPRFYKIVPTGGAESRAFLGMEIAPDNVENILARFGKSVGSVEVTPDVLLNRIMKDGRKVELQNGWTLKRVKVLGDSRIEIDGVDEDADVMRLAREPFAYSEKIGYLRVFVKPNAESLRDFLAEYPAVPDKGGLATASGTAQDLSGDKYKAPLRAYWSRIESATPAEATALGEQMRNFIVRLSSEQLGEIFDDYAALDNDSLSAAHVVRRMALDELVARGALDWKRRQQAESESRGGDIVNFDTPVTPAEDAAYMDAVKRGDMKTARRMVREAAAKAMPNTKVISRDGLPRPLSIALDEVRREGNARPYLNGEMPDEVAKIISGWETVSKSPYSNSYYNADGITWDSKPDRSLRISDHWNFWSRGEQHCKTDKPVINHERSMNRGEKFQWALGEYHAEDGTYHILKTWDAKANDYYDADGYQTTETQRQLAQAESLYVENALTALEGKKVRVDDMVRNMADGAEIGEHIRTATLKDFRRNEDGRFTATIVTRNGESYIDGYDIVNAYNVDQTHLGGRGRLEMKNKSLRDGAIDYKVFFDTETGAVKSAEVTYDDAGNVIPLSQRFNRENDDIRFDTPELSAPEMNRIAKKYGTTDEYVRGWILPDGRNVDLNPTAEGAWQDHDEIRGLLDKRRGVGGSSVTLDANGREEAMRAGAIRYHNLGDEAIIDVWRKPSARQIDALYDYVEKGEFDPGAKVTLSFSPGEFVTYDSVDEMRKRLVNDIRRHYSGVNFDTPELTPAEAEYDARKDKTPTEKDMREVFGMTNDEIAAALNAQKMEPMKGVRKSDEQLWQQAEALLSNPTYMAKLSRAAFKFARPLRDYENVALSVLFRQREVVVNELEKRRAELAAIPEEDLKETPELADELKQVSAKLAQARARMNETATAMMQGASEQGRSLRSNRVLLDKFDLSYAGISQVIAEEVGGADRITPEMDAQIRDLAKLFEDLDAQGRRIATERLKPLAEKVIKQTKDGLKVRKATERKAGDEAKRVTRNYQDALNQIEVGAVEVGGTLIGISDQQYPSWGKWLKALGEFHCFENPNITEEECINAILEDISPFMVDEHGNVLVDADQVRDALTGFGHNYRQSRYDSQRLMNDLKSQARLKRQLDWMDETNTLPPATGMVRDEPSDTTRNLQKQVAERKKEVPDAGRDERRLKGVLDSAKTRVRNRIADLQRAIETGERIPASERKVVEDMELRELKKRKAELQEVYDEMFKTDRTMTDAQRIAATEKALQRELEHAMEDFARAQTGDFSKRPTRPGVTSDTIETLRGRIRDVRDSIRELKKAKYEFGMTPDEIAALNARKVMNREKALMRQAERIATGDIGTQKKPQPPMPPDQQKAYDEMARQMKNGRRRLNQMREEARRQSLPAWRRVAGDYFKYFNGMFTAHMASFDRSAVMRQALKLTMSHPLWAGGAMKSAEIAAWSERQFQQINEDLLADPTIREAVEKFGLKLRSSDIANVHDVEMFSMVDRPPPKMIQRINAAIDRIPGVGRLYGGLRKLDRAVLENSERHYVTYLNLMAAQTYKTMLGAIPGATDWQKREAAQIVNMLAGAGAMSDQTRAGINKLNDMAGHLIWSPNLWISQIQQFFYADVLHPVFASREGRKDGGLRTKEEMMQVVKEAAKLRLRSTLAILAIGSMLALLWSDDDWEEEWKKAWKEGRIWKAISMTMHPVVGKTHIDLEMGQRTVSRFVSQFVTGEYETSSGKVVKAGDFGAKDLYDMVGRMVGGKLSPAFGTAVEIANRKMFSGEPLDWQKVLTGMLPLTPSDVVQSAVEDEWTTGQAPVAIALTILGAGGSVYDEKYYERAVNDFLNAKERYAEDVRGEIDSRIRAVKRLERRVKEMEKKGAPTEDAESEVQKMRAEIMSLLRESR